MDVRFESDEPYKVQRFGIFGWRDERYFADIPVSCDRRTYTFKTIREAQEYIDDEIRYEKYEKSERDYKKNKKPDEVVRVIEN